jgi:2-methylcitrate dehydratase PrpD
LKRRQAEVAGGGPTAALAAFASGLSPQDLPTEVIEHAKLCILDGLGCSLFATTQPWGRILTRFVTDMAGQREATLWGTAAQVPAANAALVNGTLIHSFELDDLHKVSILHPTSAALPAALAIAETDASLSGAEVLTAVIAGYEVGARVGMSVGTSQLVRGFHPTGTLGGIAAAAAAGRALRLSTEETRHAISIGATQGAGLMAAQYDSMVKRMHAGRAAQSGVYGALLACRGFTGIENVFEESYGGFCTTIGDDPDFDILTQGLGETFETLAIGFKNYACCGSCHTSVEAVKRLRKTHALAPRDIERIEVDTTQATLLHVGWAYEPSSITRAQMNLPYCVAVTLVDGEAFVEQFTDERIRSPEVVALAGRVAVGNDPEFDALGPAGRHTVRVRIICRDGRVLDEVRRHAKGSSADPLGREEVIEKFHRLASIAVGAARADAVFDAVMEMDRRFSAARWAGLLGPSDTPIVELPKEQVRNA